MKSKSQFFEKIRRQGDSRNKPLLILQALASISRGEERLRPFAEIEKLHKAALLLFSGGSKNPNPSYAFWRLQNDNLWDVESKSPPKPRKSNSDPTAAELRRVCAKGGLKRSIFDALSKDSLLLLEESENLIQTYFPSCLHGAIREFFGLNAGDSGFSSSVLAAYNSRCAISGFSAQVGAYSIGIVATPIHWLDCGGAPEVSNGVCLAKHFSEMFMLGCFTIVVQGGIFRVLLSERVDITTKRAAGGYLIRGGEPLTVPDGDLAPDPRFLMWHKRHVFLG